MSGVTKLLCDLIALPSVNPAFLPAGHPHAGEGRVASWIENLASQEGLSVRQQNVSLGRFNILAALTPLGKKRRRVLLVPHMDTINGIDEKSFLPRRLKGRIYGRGACDTKGSIAAMLTALFEVAKKGARPKETEIVFAGVVDEENAQAGSRALAASGLRADLAIVGEPTRLQVVTAHKGSLWLQLETKGRAAHGSSPHLGRNAVHEMARAVDLLETDYAKRLHTRQHPLLGSATINIGYMQGGTQPNIVPARCVAGADRRTLPGETTASVRQEINAFLRCHGLNVQLTSGKAAACAPLATDAALPLVQQLLQVCRQKKPVGVNFFCDAAVLAEKGIPSVVFGPGDIAQAHTDDEWIAESSLERATALLVKFLRELP